MEHRQFRQMATATTTSPATSQLRKKPLLSQRGSSMLKTGVLLATSTLLAGSANADNHATEDLMHGDGQFTAPPQGVSVQQNLEDKNWIIVSPDSYTITQASENQASFESKQAFQDVIELRKSSCAEGFFDDGLTYLFKNGDDLSTVRPRHIHFEVRTATAEAMETCDLRFYSVEKVAKAEVEETAGLRRLQDDEEGEGECPVEEEQSPDSKEGNKITSAPSGPTAEYKKLEFSDVALFRLGYFDYLKLNTQNMLMQYEADKWYSVDLIFDFDEQRVSIFLNNEPLKSDTFFTQRKDKLLGGNALSIYGLSPDGVSEFRNIKVCNDICSDQSELKLKDLSGAAWSMGLGLSLTAAFISLLA